jgi:ketosteroid isomerase-like protein
MAFERFIEAINRHDVLALVELMTADFVFVDGLGNRVQGAKAMEAGWRDYFAMCPDYWIKAAHVMTQNDLVLASGEAGGTIDGVAWRVPAAWQVVIREGKVAEWRVFADNKPVWEILVKRK